MEVILNSVEVNSYIIHNTKNEVAKVSVPIFFDIKMNESYKLMDSGNKTVPKTPRREKGPFITALRYSSASSIFDMNHVPRNLDIIESHIIFSV